MSICSGSNSKRALKTKTLMDLVVTLIIKTQLSTVWAPKCVITSLTMSCLPIQVALQPIATVSIIIRMITPPEVEIRTGS